MPEVTINGPEGRIEGRYFHSKTVNAPIALFLHPHPQHGGTMNNLVQGDEDEIVPPDSVEKLIDKLRQQKAITIDHRIIKGANHFFHGAMDTLVDHVGDYIDTAVDEKAGT